MENTGKNGSNGTGSSQNFTTVLRRLILNGEIKEPLVFKKIHENWEPVLWDLERWGQLFVRDGKEEKLTCRVGQQNFQYNEPQWEGLTDTTTISWSQLHSWSDERRWVYYDYKNIIQVFDSIHFEAFEWSKLGFPERNGNVGNVWIGTKGSHTPCHFDTYGCNLVSQIRGRKTWILFPPNDTNHLHPTRVPYEESSVYSQINFSCPSNAHLEELEQCSPVKITLEPGDVLFVPPKWWHFVQSDDFSISVNTWVELPEDRKSRVEEALVRFLVGSAVGAANPDSAVDILNPNEEDLAEFTEDQLEDILQKSSDDFFAHDTLETKVEKSRNPSSYDFENDKYFESESKKPRMTNLIDEFLSLYPGEGGEKLARFFFRKNSATSGNAGVFKLGKKNKYLGHFINAMGHPSILKQIAEKFLQNIYSENATTLNSNSTVRPN